MVYGHAKTLRLRTASFQIHWPPVRAEKMEEYRLRKIAIANHLHTDPGYVDLRELEWDMQSVLPTELPATPAARYASLLPDSPFDQSPIKVAELGRGTFGVVYRAVDRFSAKFIAVKQFHKLDNLEGTFQREIEVMCGLKHVSICVKQES